MSMNDPYDNSTPKYLTAGSIYDALCELVQTEEMSILSGMFEDVSWEGQTYYYTDKGSDLKAKWDELSDWGNHMWKLDLAVWQTNNVEVHDMVYDALLNDDLSKRTGFKKLFIDEILRGDKSIFDEAIEELSAALGDLNRFDYGSMCAAFIGMRKVLNIDNGMNVYGRFASEYYKKLRSIRLDEEKQLVVECRALLTSYDDFMFGLKVNQRLYTDMDKLFQAKALSLEADFSKRLELIMRAAEAQGVKLLQGEMIGIEAREEASGDE